MFHSLDYVSGSRQPGTRPCFDYHGPLATCTISTCRAHLPVSLSLYPDFLPLMIDIRLKKAY